MKKITIPFLIVLLFPLLSQSCKKDEPSLPLSEAALTNIWIYGNLDLYYLWNNNITQGIDYKEETDSEAYFYKLLYKDKDKWSYITDDYPALDAELSGEPETMGYYPAFNLTADNKVVIAVCYVYPDSPAAEAGLERGDIIISIDNAPLDTTNYYDKYSGKSYSVQLGTKVNNVLIPTGESFSMTARIIQADPSIHSTILDIEGKKIGYLAYVEFISGNDSLYLKRMDNIFSEFRDAGISDLIVDLRYNPGGAITAAAHLASEIAPFTTAASNSLMIRLEYNADLQYYLVSNNMLSNLYYTFYNAPGNLNMNRVFFLTTGRSASASELVIMGLEPYMEVIQIGTPTYGKYVASWLIHDENDKWAMMPIVSKYINYDGFTDFEDGIAPDYIVEEDLFTAVPLGDPTDPLTAKAIELATGKKSAQTKQKAMPTEMYKQLMPKEMEMKNNLIIPGIKSKR